MVKSLKLKKMKEDLGKLQEEIDEIRLTETGEERSDITSDEYTKLNELLDQTDELTGMIETEERLEKRQEIKTEPNKEIPKEQPHTDNENCFESFGEYLQSVVRASMSPGDYSIGGKPTGRVDRRLIAYDSEGRAISGMGETVPSDGGFLLTVEYSNELLAKVHKTGLLADRCRQITLNPRVSSIKIPGVDESSRADGSRRGGIRAYWVEEGGSKTSSKAKLRMITLDPMKLTGLVYLTDELIQDVSALGQYVSDFMSEEFSFKIDDGIINGTGAGQPLGILNANALVSVAKETGQAATTIKAENIEKMYARMWAPSMNNAIWLINQDCWPQIFQLHHAVGTGGAPMFIPAGYLNQTPNGTLMGRPIVPIEHCQTLGTKGDIFFVDLSQYIIARKGGMQSATSIHVRFLYDESVMRFVLRLDGQPMWNVALTPYKGSNTQSPYVALAART